MYVDFSGRFRDVQGSQRIPQIFLASWQTRNDLNITTLESTTRSHPSTTLGLLLVPIGKREPARARRWIRGVRSRFVMCTVWPTAFADLEGYFPSLILSWVVPFVYPEHHWKLLRRLLTLQLAGFSTLTAFTFEGS